MNKHHSSISKNTNFPPIIFIPFWLSANESSQLYDELLTLIDWKSETIKLFGKKIVVPRKISWIGDKEAVYKYSGITHYPMPWISSLQNLRNRLLDQHNLKFNSVLCNYYKDGYDSVGWHQDNESHLGMDPVIASISLGADRRFLMQEIASKEKYEIMLNSGSLLIMKKGCQALWRHCLPKMATVKSARINFTFRLINENKIGC